MQLKRKARKECASPGCHVRIKDDEYKCALHGASTKKIRQKSNRTYPKETRLAKQAIQLYIRLRDSDINGICRDICDGTPVEWNKCDGGHYYPADKYPALRFDEVNINAQRKINNKLMGDPEMIRMYTDGIIKKWGQHELDRLNRQKHLPVYYDEFKLKAIRFKYTELSEKIHFQKFGKPLVHELLEKPDYKAYCKKLFGYKK